MTIHVKPLPAAPLPASVDLRGLPYMPLDVVRLRDSELVIKTKPVEFRCAVLLWCASWHQVPAASLPDDDEILADLAGFGSVVKEWRRHRAGAMRGFVKCADGRFYHAVVVEKAITAWLARLEQRHKTLCSTISKRNQRAGAKKEEAPTFAAWIEHECPEAQPYLSNGTSANVQRDRAEDTPGMSDGTSASVPQDNAARPAGQGPLSGRKPPPREVKGSEVPSTNRFPGDSNSTAPADAATAADEPKVNPDHVARIVDECRRARMDDANDGNAVIRRWARDGATPGQVMIALAEARKPGCKPAPMPLPAGYVDAILERIIAEDAEARRVNEARAAETQRLLAEQRGQVPAPPPEGFFDKPKAAAA